MNKLGYEILEFIKDAGKGIEEFVTTPYGHLSLHPRVTYYSRLKSLEKQKFVVKRSKGRSGVYFLTAKGKKLISKPQSRVRRNDGYSTIVIFDIPEKKSRERTIFRRWLQANGYSLLQKSVFISPDQSLVDLKDLIQELGIYKNVTVISGKIDRFI